MKNIFASCSVCGDPVDSGIPENMGSDPDIREILSRLKPMAFCPKCSSTAVESIEHAERYQADRERLWKSICPPEYRQTAMDHPGIDAKAVQKVLTHDFSRGKGLVLVGNPRTGKTRAAFKALEKLHWKGSSVRYKRATQLKAWNSSFRSDVDFEKAVRGPAVFFIDDIGKAMGNNWSESVLWEVLEIRIAFDRPFIVTTNSTGEQLTESMGQESARAVIDRIRENCRTITFKQQGGDND